MFEQPVDDEARVKHLSMIFPKVIFQIRAGRDRNVTFRILKGPPILDSVTFKFSYDANFVPNRNEMARARGWGTRFVTSKRGPRRAAPGAGGSTLEL